MAKQTSDYNPTGFNCASVTFDATDTTVEKPVIAASAEDSTIGLFTISNASTYAAIMEILLYDGADSHLLTTVTVPARAGTDGAEPVYDVMALSCIYNASLPLKGGWSVYARATVTLDADLIVTVIASDY